MGIFERSAVALLGRLGSSWSDIASSIGSTDSDALDGFGSAGAKSGFAELRLAAVSPESDSRGEAVLLSGNVYTRNELRELFEIRAATLNNGVFHFGERREIWLFITENKQADREQYVDKLVGNTLYWQGQRMGRTDRLIINHKRDGEKLLVFYRQAKYEFEQAGFKYEGVFDYISHSGDRPTSFVLRRAIQ
jgi:hypothetical protein